MNIGRAATAAANGGFRIKRIPHFLQLKFISTFSSWNSSCGRRRENVVDRATKDGEIRVYVVAGEVSGDSIASRLMNSIKRISPLPVRFAGVGGALMQKEGLQSIFPMEDISVMGIWELLPYISKIRNRLKETTNNAFCFRPHVVVTIDAKGFSFRFLQKLKDKYSQQGVDNSPIHVHYVAPSFWAWKGGEARLKGINGFVDHVLCIIPFEEEVCRKNGLPATFVGHPILEDASNFNRGTKPVTDTLFREGNLDHFHSKYGIDYGSTIITLLPGSRLQEVTRMLPIFLNAMKLLKESFPRLIAVIPVAPDCHVQAYIAKTLKEWSTPAILIPGTSIYDKYDAFSASSAALCTSGTAVLELQLARLPCLVAYRAHILTEWVIKWRTKLRFISLPNILFDRAVIPEALFDKCTPKNISRLLKEIVYDVNIREMQSAAAENVLRNLHPLLISNFPAEKKTRLFLDNWDNWPSAIAAKTILYAVKKTK